MPPKRLSQGNCPRSCIHAADEPLLSVALGALACGRVGIGSVVTICADVATADSPVGTARAFRLAWLTGRCLCHLNSPSLATAPSPFER
eukprot:1470157-Prymnesium_polylepis.1